MSVWPITLEEVRAARERLRPYLSPTPLRNYAALDAAVGRGVKVYVKHENHNPTNAFKVRNALSVMTALSDDERRRGVVAATRGNHGMGLAWVGGLLGVPVVICVPVGNNPEKNEAMRGFGAEVLEEGEDYDESVDAANRLVRERGLRLVHATNDKDVLCGAATITLEMIEQNPSLDAAVLAVGGGSQAVGAMTVARAARPAMAVFGVQAEGASAIHDAWHAGHPTARESADTFADGLATRNTYEMTFEALREGLAGFVKVSESEMASSLRLLMRTTHNMVEGAGAAGLAGLLKLRDKLAGKSVAIVLSGANIDEATLERVVTGRL